MFELGWHPRKIDLIDGVDLYLLGEGVENVMYIWIYIIGSQSDAKNYAYTLSISSKSDDKFTYYGHVKPIDERLENIVAKQVVFMVGIEAIKKFSDENNILPIEVTIHALKEEAKDMDLESGVEDESE